MTRQKTAAKATAGECLHPEDKAFNEPRNDGSGKGDRICGVCGWTMCEVNIPADVGAGSGIDAKTGQMCTHPPFSRNWKLIGSELSGLFCDCGKDMGDRQPAPGRFPAVQDGDPETEAAVQAAEKDLGICQDGCDVVDGGCADAGLCGREVSPGDGPATSPFSDDTGDVTQRPCVNHTCDNYAADGSGTGCNVLGWDEIRECKTFISGPLEEAEPAESTGEGEDHREAFVPEERSTSYVTREPHKISSRFQELMPVSVDDEELGKLGTEMAEQFGTWRKTKLDLKKFTKACKEVTDRCEARMVELEEIIQDQARMEPVDCQWEYDFAAGEKALRRCDTWKIVKRETLTVEERQLSLDLDRSSANAVEKLREMQQALGNHAEEEIRSICAACVGNCEEDGTLHDPSSKLTACTGHRSAITLDAEEYRNGVCKDWRLCPLAVKCFGLANETGDNTDCLLNFPEFHHIKLQEIAPINLEELQALLALVGRDVAMEILSQQSDQDLLAAQEWAGAVHLQASDNDDVEVPAPPFFLKNTQIAAPAGELVGNGYPMDPDHVGEALQEAQEEAGFVQDPEEEEDPLGAALAVEE